MTKSSSTTSPTQAPARRKLSWRLLAALAIVALGGGLGLSLGLQSMRHELTAKLYQAKLHTLTQDYTELREQYNDAVRQQAITELVVADGKLTVTRRDATGYIQSIETDVDINQPVYVDFIVHQDRLWVRSIYDASIAPENATVIDPEVWGIDWNNTQTAYGLVTYRKLDEGRWVVTASQNGGLMLRRIQDNESIQLVSPLTIQSFEVMQKEVEEKVNTIDWFKMLFHKPFSNQTPNE